MDAAFFLANINDIIKVYMKNQALYTKYRPISFKQVINQDIVVDFLQKSIANNRVNHFYIFSGNKGTGKTTIARIFSKTLNCESGGVEPCNMCNNCLSNINVIEIDAASNNGVDNIRSLIEKSHQVNISGAFKVFIIDEAHMLTKSAFNAMLKTLEESSSGNVFILATTEIEKIPDTIISRAINLYFNNINKEHIEKLISKIAKSENYQIEDQAVEIIASSSNNAARNALINLQKAAIYGTDNITASDCSKLFQIADFTLIRQLFEEMNNQSVDVENWLTKLDFIQNRFNVFLEQLLDYSINSSNQGIYKYLMNVYNIYLKSLNPQLCLKMILNYQIQANNVVVNQSVSNVQNRGLTPTSNTVVSSQRSSMPVENNFEPKSTISVGDILNKATSQDRLLWAKRWMQNSKLIKEKEFMNVILLLLESEIVAASKEGIIICVAKDYAVEKLNKLNVELRKLLKYYSGYDFDCVVLKKEQWLLERENYLQNKNKVKKSVSGVFGADFVEEI